MKHILDPTGMTKLRYFDPTDRTEVKILDKIKTRLTFA